MFPFKIMCFDTNKGILAYICPHLKECYEIAKEIPGVSTIGDNFLLPALKCIAKPKTDPQRLLKASNKTPTIPQPIKSPAVVKKIVNAPRPLVLILNHHIFRDGREREGSAQDVQALHRTFTSLNCDVIEILNPTLDVVKQKFKNCEYLVYEIHIYEINVSIVVEKDSLMHLPALVIVILSHGDRNDVIETCDNKRYNLNDDVLYPLFNNKTLDGKPKILITQACKGNLEVDAIPIRYSPQDYIKCYSTTEGFRSYRDPDSGSPYIQALCTHLEVYGKEWDFESLIRQVGIAVASETFQG